MFIKNINIKDKVFDTVNIALLTIIMLIVIYPLIYVISASLSNPDLVNSGKVWLFPRDIMLEGYTRVFRNKDIMTGYRNTIFYAVAGTLINLTLTLPAAYALSKKYLPGQSVVMFGIALTMYFSGGMIPTYLVVRNLRLLNTWLVLLVTSGISTYNLILARTFFSSGVPEEIEDAAKCDGCTPIRTFLVIVLPLSKALIGVLALYYGVSHWNSWFNALIYLNDRKKITLQLVLREILVTQQLNAEMSEGSMMDDDAMTVKLKVASLIRYSSIVVSSVPVIVVYPFLQKYFNKGVMLGSLKS